MFLKEHAVFIQHVVSYSILLILVFILSKCNEYFLKMRHHNRENKFENVLGNGKCTEQMFL